VLRGRAYVEKGAYDRAIEDFDQALRVKPRDAIVTRAVAEGLKARGFAVVEPSGARVVVTGDVIRFSMWAKGKALRARKTINDGI